MYHIVESLFFVLAFIGSYTGKKIVDRIPQNSFISATMLKCKKLEFESPSFLLIICVSRQYFGLPFVVFETTKNFI